MAGTSRRRSARRRRAVRSTVGRVRRRFAKDHLPQKKAITIAKNRAT